MAKYKSVSLDVALDADLDRFLERHPRGEGWKNKRNLVQLLLTRGLRLLAGELAGRSPSPPPAAAAAVEPRTAPPSLGAPPPVPAPADADQGRGRSRRRAKAAVKDAKLEDPEDDEGDPAPPEPEGEWTCPKCGEAMPWIKRVGHDCPALRRGPPQQQVLAPPPAKKDDVDLLPLARASFVRGRWDKGTRPVQLSKLRTWFRGQKAEPPAEDVLDRIREDAMEEMRGTKASPAPPVGRSLKLDPIMQRLPAFKHDAKRHFPDDPAAQVDYLVAGVLRVATEQDYEMSDQEARDLLAKLGALPEAVA